EPALSDAEIERRIDVVLPLEERVAPRDAEVGRAVLHVSRHIVRLQEHEAHRTVLRVAHQLAVVFVERGHVDAGAREARPERAEAIRAWGDGEVNQFWEGGFGARGRWITGSCIILRGGGRRRRPPRGRWGGAPRPLRSRAPRGRR